MPLSRIKPQMESSQLRLDSSAASTDVNDRVLLNGTDSSSTGDGYAVILEDATANAFDGGPFILSEAPISVANPAFRAALTANQGSISHNTYTKLAYDHVDYDMGGYYDFTNSRYQPLIAGYYQFNVGQMDYSANDVYDFMIGIYKTGQLNSQSRLRLIVPGVSNEDFYASINNVSDVLYLNGTTDYVEVFMKSLSEDSSGTMIAYGNISGGFGVGMNSFFSGTLISRTS